jgi:hypothetical protein
MNMSRFKELLKVAMKSVIRLATQQKEQFSVFGVSFALGMAMTY